MSVRMNRKGLRAISAGLALWHKDFRTPEEEAALRSFKKMMLWLLVIVFVSLPVLLVIFYNTGFQTANNTRLTGFVDGEIVSGTEMVDGGRIVFKDFTLEELGIEPSSVSDGDKILFHYDKNDVFTFAEPEEIYLQRGRNEVLILVAGIILLMVVPVFIVSYTVGKPFLTWYKSIS